MHVSLVRPHELRAGLRVPGFRRSSFPCHSSLGDVGLYNAVRKRLFLGWIRHASRRAGAECETPHPGGKLTERGPLVALRDAHVPPRGPFCAAHRLARSNAPPKSPCARFRRCSADMSDTGSESHRTSRRVSPIRPRSAQIPFRLTMPDPFRLVQASAGPRLIKRRLGDSGILLPSSNRKYALAI